MSQMGGYLTHTFGEFYLLKENLRRLSVPLLGTKNCMRNVG